MSQKWFTHPWAHQLRGFIYFWIDERSHVLLRRCGSNVKDLSFERGAVNIPVLSPNHFWHLFSTKYGPLIRAIQALGGQSPTKVKELENDFIRSITPYVHENLTRLDYLLTLAMKA